jgi:hypothetical protein
MHGSGNRPGRAPEVKFHYETHMVAHFGWETGLRFGSPDVGRIFWHGL